MTGIRFSTAITTASASERDTMQTEAKYARRVLPWDWLAKLLF
jgi:hypothetical protein